MRLLILVFFLVSCKQVYEDLSDVKYEIVRFSTDSVEYYTLRDEFRFVQDSKNRITKVEISGNCTDNLENVHEVSSHVSETSFPLSVALSPDFLLAAQVEATSYECDLNVSGFTSIGSVKHYTDVEVKFDEDSFNGGIDVDDGIYIAYEELNKGTIIKGSIVEGIKYVYLVCEDVTISSKELHDVTYEMQVFDLSGYNKGDLVGKKCFLTNGKFRTSDYKWSKPFKILK